MESVLELERAVRVAEAALYDAVLHSRDIAVQTAFIEWQRARLDYEEEKLEEMRLDRILGDTDGC